MHVHHAEVMAKSVLVDLDSASTPEEKLEILKDLIQEVAEEAWQSGYDVAEVENL